MPGISRGTQESCRDRPVARTVTRICRCDLLVIDYIGILAADQDAAEAFHLPIDPAGSPVVVTAQKSVN